MLAEPGVSNLVTQDVICVYDQSVTSVVSINEVN
jgi:hypothetical protein